MGMEMEMNHWEWEGMGLKKTFPLIATFDTSLNACSTSNPVPNLSESE